MRDLREQEKERPSPDKKLDITNSRASGYRLPAIHGRSELVPITYFYNDGWYYRTRSIGFSNKEFVNRIILAAISTGVFGWGVGAIITGFFR